MATTRTLWLLLAAALAAPAGPVEALEPAGFLVPPRIVIRHTPDHAFIGPSMIRVRDGDILMAAPWTHSPDEVPPGGRATRMPMVYRSRDNGRTWAEDGPFAMRWEATGVPGYGGISLVRLQDGRIAALFHRNVAHGGGVPVIAFSADEGRTWTDAKPLTGDPGVYYVMNDRLIQLGSGRLVVPASHKLGAREGDHDEALAFLSDDGGVTWRRSRGAARLDPLPGGINRGMAEPCAVELRDGRILLLSRTGAGCHHKAVSADGGETWSSPEPTSLVAACSPLTLYRLPDGRLIVFYEHATPVSPGSLFPRNPLVYATSCDEGRSWSPPRVIDDEALVAAHGETLQHIYPGACFLPEGVLLFYSSHFAYSDGRAVTRPDAWRFGGGKVCLLRYP